MKTKHLGLFFVFFAFFQNLSAQDKDIRPTVEIILSKLYQFQDSIILYPSAVQNPLKIGYREHANAYREYLNKLKDMEAKEHQFTGEISFGLNGLEGENNNLFVINTGFSLANGTYPFAFEVSSGVLAQIQNGSLEESVSNLAISFDYFLKENLAQQAYVFVNGNNNSFLGIDQRYEMGGGVVLNAYSGDKKDGMAKDKNKNGLTKEGEKEMKALDENPFFNKSAGTAYVDSLSNTIGAKEENKTLGNAGNRFKNIIKKNYSTTRLSLLGGLNYELERTADSLQLYDGALERKWTFDATNRFRMVLRPSFVWKNDNFSFSTKAYIKMGVFGEFTNKVEEGPFSDTRADYWVDWTSKLKFDVTEKIGLEIEYYFFYDNAPNRLYFDIATNGEADLQLFEAEKIFRSLSFRFTYSL